MYAAVQQIRRASTSSHAHQFPFPTGSRPTPHQIFHLPPGATQAAVKSRYYELVRVHHPDSPQCRNVPASVRHARFQAITHAYEVLKGRQLHQYDPVLDELERRRRHMATRARPRRTDFPDMRASEAQWKGPAVDTWKDWVILSAGLFALAAGLFPTMWYPMQNAEKMHFTAAENLARARAEAREYGEERRREIRRRVQDARDNKSDASLVNCPPKPTPSTMTVDDKTK